MRADRANLRSALADVDVAAVAALPDISPVLLEDGAVFKRLEQLEVSLLVRLLDSAYALELIRDLLEALFSGFLSHTIVHIGPFAVLAGSGRAEVLRRRAYSAEMLEPHLRVLFFVERGFLKYRRDLLVALLLRLGSEVGILVSRLGFPRECLH